VLSDSIQAYIGVIQQTELLRLNINNEQVLGRQLQATNERFRVGEITRTGVGQAEAGLPGRVPAHPGGGQPPDRAGHLRAHDRGAPARLTNPQPLQVPVRSAQTRSGWRRRTTPSWWPRCSRPQPRATAWTCSSRPSAAGLGNAQAFARIIKASPTSG
jgi:outer membrane protein